MRHSGGLDHSGSFELHLPGVDLVEQSNAVTEQQSHYVNLYLVEESGSHVLLNGVRAAAYVDILVTCRCFRLLEGALNTVRDEENPGATSSGTSWKSTNTGTGKE